MEKTRLNEIQGRLDAAVPGPWTEQGGVIWSDLSSRVGMQYCDDPVAECYGAKWEENAALITHAPEDIADLLQEVRRLKQENERLRVDLAFDDEWEHGLSRCETCGDDLGEEPGPCSCGSYGNLREKK